MSCRKIRKKRLLAPPPPRSVKRRPSKKPLNALKYMHVFWNEETMCEDELVHIDFLTAWSCIIHFPKSSIPSPLCPGHVIYVNYGKEYKHVHYPHIFSGIKLTEALKRKVHDFKITVTIKEFYSLSLYVFDQHTVHEPEEDILAKGVNRMMQDSSITHISFPWIMDIKTATVSWIHDNKEKVITHMVWPEQLSTIQPKYKVEVYARGREEEPAHTFCLRNLSDGFEYDNIVPIENIPSLLTHVHIHNKYIKN
jgi:hypothetical protein